MVVKNVSRYLVNKFLVRRLRGPFRHEKGTCWSVPLPALTPYADTEIAPKRSTLALYENGFPLQQAHSLLDEVRTVGLGRYCHWRDRLYFSTTDNSDPTTNGRTYQYSLSPWLYKRRIDRPEIEPSLPVNFRKRDVSPERIRADVDYALQVGRHYLKWTQSLGTTLTDKTVLEVGPGINYGSVMVLASQGAVPLVLDRFLALWERPYHPLFYGMLRDELRRSDPQADVGRLTALLQADCYPEAAIRRVAASLEELPLAANSIDFVFSNAVVEHLSDLESSFAQMYRVTRPGGYGHHQVDFRDHRNFDLPLEYLLFEEEEFRIVFEQRHAECGNRWRPQETTERLVATGFEIVAFQANGFCTPNYLAEFLPRLRASTSRYRDWPEEQLTTICGLYTLRKPVR